MGAWQKPPGLDPGACARATMLTSDANGGSRADDTIPSADPVPNNEDLAATSNDNDMDRKPMRSFAPRP